MDKEIICNYCFDDEKLSQWIKKQGIKIEDNNFKCPNCKTSVMEVDEIYVLDKKKLVEKLKEIILNLYENDIELGMYYFAEKNLCDNGEDSNYYAQLKSLEDVCYDLFGDERLANIISENVSWKDIADGGYDDYFSDVDSPLWKDKCWWGYGEFGWNYFSYKVKHSLRFFDTPEFNRLEELQKLDNLFEKIEINKYKKIVFRARGAYSEDEIKNIEENPEKQLGQAPKEKAGHNRFSPSGISYVYLSFDEKTAMSEVFDKNHIALFIAKFKLDDNLKLLDLTKLKFDKIKIIYSNYFNDNFDLNIYCGLNSLEKFINEIKKPISENESRLEYIPTQILAEYIKLKGYDGFIFDSSKTEKGKNLVLFDNKTNYLEFERKYMIDLSIKLKDYNE